MRRETNTLTIEKQDQFLTGFKTMEQDCSFCSKWQKLKIKFIYLFYRREQNRTLETDGMK